MKFVEFRKKVGNKIVRVFGTAQGETPNGKVFVEESNGRSWLVKIKNIVKVKP